MRFLYLDTLKTDKTFDNDTIIGVPFSSTLSYGVKGLIYILSSLHTHYAVDVGCFPGFALAALDLGCHHVFFTGEARYSQALESIASKQKSTIYRASISPSTLAALTG